MLENVPDLSILWDDIPELPGQSILAALDSSSKTVDPKGLELSGKNDGEFQSMLSMSPSMVLVSKRHARSCLNCLACFETLAKHCRRSTPNLSGIRVQAPQLPMIRTSAPAGSPDRNARDPMWQWP